MSKDTLNSEENEFTERADFIIAKDLAQWDVQNQHFHDIQLKILAKGAKLLVGPRGTGKTHQMKVVYQNCIKTQSTPLPVYVSFNKYFSLEQFKSKSLNAINIFHTWVLSKILLGCYETLKDLEITEDLINSTDSRFTLDILNEFVSEAEKGFTNQRTDILLKIVSPSKIIIAIETLINRLGRKRAILMLDDAALILTPDYMVEFFDIFRSLKTSLISPKASVYPGTTEYGPNFHVSHDAERVECWMSVEDNAYSEFMESLIDKRFSKIRTQISPEILELLKYASFGVPRSFIVLLRSFSQLQVNSVQKKINELVEQQTGLVKAEYLTLQMKMPQYKTVIGIGFNFFEKILVLVRSDNKGANKEKQILIGIQSDTNNMLERMIRFLVEAGLLYDKGSVSHGEDRDYQRYIPHLLFLIGNKTFSDGSRGFNPKHILDKIKATPKKHPIRRTFQSMLSKEQIAQLKLDLPVCKYCQTSRLTEDQRFCHSCGNQLVNQSAFEECLKTSIDQLPLTAFQRQKASEVGFTTVGDFITKKDAATALQKAPQIGKKRSSLILSTVERVIEEFLE